MTDERDRLSVLVVCTANVCRSPLAQRLLQRAFAESAALGRFTVWSAGAFVQEDAPMCALSGAVLDGDDDWVQAHRSRRLTAQLVAASDLILTMERGQRSIAARLVPRSQAKIFTMTEAAQLAELLADDRGISGDRSIGSLVSGLHGKRGYAPPPPRPQRRWGRQAEPVDHLTIEDGHGLNERVHRQAVEATRAATMRLAAAFERATAVTSPAGVPEGTGR